MNGIVDESLRALLDVPVAAAKGDERTSIRVWIDTAFNGGLVIPRQSIEQLGLKQRSTTAATLHQIGFAAVRSLQLLPGALVGQSARRQLPQFVVHQRQQSLGPRPA